MADKPLPDRISVSIPSDAEVTKGEIEQLVESSEYESVSEFVRQAIESELSQKDLSDSDNNEEP